MAFNVQNDDGTVVDANAYIDVATFKAYHDSRGNDYSAYSDTLIQKAIVRATDFVDTRFTYKGVKLNTDPENAPQFTQWPRRAGSEQFAPWYDINFLTPLVDVSLGADTFVALVGPDGTQILGIPEAVKRATAEYALRALSLRLFEDAPAPSGGKDIKSESIHVDVIRRDVEYVEGQAGAFALPVYPTADLLLTRAGLIVSGRRVMR
jgi:hypothetical protein